jgi:thiamine kinase-like enzyme
MNSYLCQPILLWMNDFVKQTILEKTGASSLFLIETLQSLWSGYGSILRVGLENGLAKTVVVKHVCPPSEAAHPKGWNSDFSHNRKVKSYQVETAWYQSWSFRCTSESRIPNCLGIANQGSEVCMVLEDMDAAGYSARKSAVARKEITICLQWLAHFHAEFLQETPVNLWEKGTYWHLETRPDEWAVLTDEPLKNAAKEIAHVLHSSPYKTIVHGDAKLANFCFSEDGTQVAAVDFQYTGGGCGMQDVAYFVGSCLNEHFCEQWEEDLLQVYFRTLQAAVLRRGKQVDFTALETSWRDLYPFAWTDFHRFLKGWSPEHWKINTYSERMARSVLKRFESQS